MNPGKIAVFLTILLIMSGIASHEAGAGDNVSVRKDELFVRHDDTFTKFGRGFGNTLFGFGEMVRQTQIAWDEQGTTVGTFTGFVRGLYWSVIRTGVGVYELVSFPFAGMQNYGPILQPESVLDEVGTR